MPPCCRDNPGHVIGRSEPLLAVASSNQTPAEASIQGGLDAPPGWPQQRGDDKGGDGP
jgi:hypothetical protein